jgi:hypothetical protein
MGSVMGLDQYANSRDSKGEETEIAYWRKHNALQGWMESLWSLKTGKSGNELNCQELELTTEDLDQLYLRVRNGTLPETQGFFFGYDTSREEMRKEYDFEFIAKAKEAIKEGGKVFYTCWW